MGDVGISGCRGIFWIDGFRNFGCLADGFGFRIYCVGFGIECWEVCWV